MSSHVNYVCWTSENVNATIPTEAATPSKQVLLATHAPLRITLQGTKGGKPASGLVNERQVLDDFLTSEPTNGVLVAPVIGESGTGKSHLVRWVDAMIPRGKGRHVIYLKKTDTSLKNVVEELLVGQQGAEFEEIRSKVGSLGSGVTLEMMESRILDALAEALTTHEGQSPAAKALVGSDGLALFFRDPLFREHLLRPGSFVKLRAKHALQGRDPDEPDVPLEFTVDELPLDIGNVADILEAAAKTRRLFQRLAGNNKLQIEAVSLLNELLDVAVTRAASLGVGDVSQAFLRMRENLVGEEIILLIEDVALIQGVRRDLLDAIVEPGVVQGVLKYATVRTMMAVTSGYYQESLPETFRYRAEPTSPLYAVDVDLAGAAADDDLFIDFVGRYLNAARVGKSILESESPDVRNKCSSCPVRGTCHENFGASADGFGLYPYNRPAILRAVKSYADLNGDRRTFNPRRVLSRVVRDALNDGATTIPHGEFPPAGFLSGGPGERGLPTLSQAMRARIEEHLGEADAGRLQALLTLWGDAGRTSIEPGVLTAFSHPPIPEDVFAPEPRPGPDPDPDPGPGPGPDPIPNSVKRNLEAIENWSAGAATLPPKLASDLRSTIREALLAKVNWFDPVIKDPDTNTLKRAVPVTAAGISIQGATENIQNANPVLVVQRNARNGQMFSGLVLLKAGFPERAGEALPRLDALVTPAVNETRKRIIEVLEVDDSALVDAAASLLRGAASCGRLPDKPKDADLLNALVWTGVGHQRSDAVVRRPEWNAAFDAYLASRSDPVKHLLAGVGAAQGTGAVHAIDVDRLLPVVRSAWQRVVAGEAVVAPKWCERAEQKAGVLRRLAPVQIDEWQHLLKRIRKHLPAGTSLAETVSALTDAAKAGTGFGLVKVHNLQDLERANDEATTYNAASITGLEKLLAAVTSADERTRLSLVGSEVGPDLIRIAQYLEMSADWVEAGLAQAQADGGVSADIDEEIHSAIAQWTELAGQLDDDEDAVRELGGDLHAQEGDDV